MILELQKNKLYFLLLLVAISFLILSFTDDKNETLAINVHDTYYIISYQHGFILLCFIFLTIGFLYLIFSYFKIQLISILSLSHIFGSLIFIGLFFYYLHLVNSVEDFPLFDSIDYNFRIIVSLLLFAFFQLILFLNLIISIIKKLLYRTTQ
jgi:heme/copper-type cytochrome/quinol oxidase subunit 1